MAKKFLLSIVFVMAFTLLLTACSGNNSTTNSDHTSKSDTSSTSTHLHTYGDWIPTQAASCTTNGTREKYCSCGEKITETVQATGHCYGEWTILQAVTCSANGTKAKYCVCGEKITETILSTGHNYVDATCTEDKHCTNCNKSYPGTATGHVMQRGACVYCKMPGASMEWGHDNDAWVEYYYLYDDGGYVWKGGGSLIPDYGYDGFAFYRDGYLFFELYAERSGMLIFDYQITDSSGRIVKHGYISVGNVSQGDSYTFDKYIGKLEPGEYTLTVSSKNALD